MRHKKEKAIVIEKQGSDGSGQLQSKTHGHILCIVANQWFSNYLPPGYVVCGKVNVFSCDCSGPRERSPCDHYP